MASVSQLQVASNILLDHFGELVEKVVSCLLSIGSQSLREIINSTKLRPNEVFFRMLNVTAICVCAEERVFV